MAVPCSVAGTRRPVVALVALLVLRPSSSRPRRLLFCCFVSLLLSSAIGADLIPTVFSLSLSCLTEITAKRNLAAGKTRATTTTTTRAMTRWFVVVVVVIFSRKRGEGGERIPAHRLAQRARQEDDRGLQQPAQLGRWLQQDRQASLQILGIGRQPRRFRK